MGVKQGVQVAPRYLTRGRIPSSAAATATGPRWRSSRGNQSGQQLSGQGSSHLCCQLCHCKGKTWCLKVEIPPPTLETVQQCKRYEMFAFTFKPGGVLELQHYCCACCSEIFVLLPHREEPFVTKCCQDLFALPTDLLVLCLRLT